MSSGSNKKRIGHWLLAAAVGLVVVAAITALYGLPDRIPPRPPQTALASEPLRVIRNKQMDKYKVGDRFVLTVVPGQECFLFAFYIDDDMTARSLYPLESNASRLIKAGKAVVIDRVKNHTMLVDSSKNTLLLIAAIPANALGKSVAFEFLDWNPWLRAGSFEQTDDGCRLLEAIQQLKDRHPESVFYTVQPAPRGHQSASISCSDT